MQHNHPKNHQSCNSTNAGSKRLCITFRIKEEGLDPKFVIASLTRKNSFAHLNIDYMNSERVPFLRSSKTCNFRNKHARKLCTWNNRLYFLTHYWASAIRLENQPNRAYQFMFITHTHTQFIYLNVRASYVLPTVHILSVQAKLEPVLVG